MPVYRSIRIAMPDRPGALSAVSAALAVQGVNIVRLEIVGHDGDMVVDDLLLGCDDEASITRAVGTFAHDVTVRTFEELRGDPSLAMAEGLMAMADATSREHAFEEMTRHALQLARANSSVLGCAQPDGSMSIVDREGNEFVLDAEEPFVGRWALHRQAAAAFAPAGTWAPEPVAASLPGAWIAMAPIGPFDLLMLSRSSNIPFLGDELERLATFAEVAGRILRLRGELSCTGSLPAGREAQLPDGALTLARHQRVKGRSDSIA